ECALASPQLGLDRRPLQESPRRGEPGPELLFRPLLPQPVHELDRDRDDGHYQQTGEDQRHHHRSK
ncbi:MAG: hypothetical protein RMJ52_00780, partial [Gemmataceae bacterium]|nr:hypothetical protein [Gemmataceae bacterium]